MTYVLLFAASFMGSMHCVGMCGAFMLMLKAQNPEDVRVRQVLYLLGKTLTYMLLGGIIATLGTLVDWQGSSLGLVVQWVAGIVMILTGLGLLNIFGKIENWLPLNRWKPYQKTFQMLMRLKGRNAAFALGMLNGFLPCGLVYAALAQASLKSPAEAVLVMFVFGVATIPALLSVGWVSQKINFQRKAYLSYFAGLLIIALGGVTLVRGTTYYAKATTLITGKKTVTKSCCERKR